MESMESQFHNACTVWLSSRIDNVAGVTYVEQETEESGYCESCYYTEIVIVIHYTDNEGQAKRYVYDGSMSDFIREL